MCSLTAVAEVLRAGAGATKHPKAVCSFLFVFLFFLCFLPPHYPQSTQGLVSTWLSVSESDLKGPVLLGKENMTGMVSDRLPGRLCVMEGAQQRGFLKGVLAQTGSLESFLGGNQKNQNIVWEVRSISDPWAKGTPVPPFILSPAPHFPHM